MYWTLYQMRHTVGMYILRILQEHSWFWFPWFYYLFEFFETLKLLLFMFNLPDAFCFIESTMCRRDVKINPFSYWNHFFNEKLCPQTGKTSSTILGIKSFWWITGKDVSIYVSQNIGFLVVMKCAPQEIWCFEKQKESSFSPVIHQILISYRCTQWADRVHWMGLSYSSNRDGSTSTLIENTYIAT